MDLDKIHLIMSTCLTGFRPGEVAMVVGLVTEDTLARALTMEGLGVPECFRKKPCLSVVYSDGIVDIVPVAAIECGEYEIVEAEDGS